MKPNFSSVILLVQAITNGNFSKPGISSCFFIEFQRLIQADGKEQAGNETESKGNSKWGWN